MSLNGDHHNPDNIVGSLDNSGDKHSEDGLPFNSGETTPKEVQLNTETAPKEIPSSTFFRPRRENV